MKAVLLASLATLSFGASASAALAADAIPATARKVVLEKKDGGGYQWKLVAAAPVPKPGDSQVLVRVRAVFAAQFAVAAGARVIVTSSSDEKLLKVRNLGARDDINYKSTPAWSARVLELTAGHGADLIVDVGGKDTLDESAKSVAYAGQISLVGGLAGYDGRFRAAALINRSVRAQGIYVGSRADFMRMNAFIEKHRLRPVIERVVPLEQYPDALKQMADSNFVGKIVLRL